MESAPLLKPVLKRGALVAAANWQVTLIQATADSLFKLLIATPLIGGLFLVGLVIGAAPEDLTSLVKDEVQVFSVVGIGKVGESEVKIKTVLDTSASNSNLWQLLYWRVE